ncbi:MAG TPA: class I SAM-dependent rRNA methyltransferase [Candidatus Angelobacter sp.]|nr:class I SAM-dependent rRNA methyltransferase [Candidatus Angelobacter sp.]
MASPVISRVTISPRAAARLRAGHVWVYSSDVTDDAGAAPGALVHVQDTRKQFLGSAIHSSSSQLKLRLLTRERMSLETGLPEMVRARVASAVAYRKTVVRDSDACRLVFSEADLLPGLVVDQYNDIVTLQILTQAWDQPERREAILSGIREATGIANIAERTDQRIRELEQLPPLESAMLQGSKSTTVVTMNGVRLHYDALGGQKTGAFLDQRENYAAAAVYGRGAALDVCTYQGGFALHLARVCESVTAIDVSREALEIAEQNEKLNASAKSCAIEWMEANAFDLLKDYSALGQQYDVIVLDPPAFARGKRNVSAALRGYKELNLRALRMLRPGGILVTCSCSFHFSEAEFIEVLTAAAQDAHRSVRLLEKRTQSQDHPVLLGIPETYYLKCLICSVI